MTIARVGVIGTGAMGGGVVQALVRAGIPTVVRDIRPDAQDAAVRHGASPAASPADLARRCDVVIVLVVDALEVETVLFGADGAAAALAPRAAVLASSTVDPARPAQWAPRVARFGAVLLDAPVSGGPAKAAAGTMSARSRSKARASASASAPAADDAVLVRRALQRIPTMPRAR